MRIIRGDSGAECSVWAYLDAIFRGSQLLYRLIWVTGAIGVEVFFAVHVLHATAGVGLWPSSEGSVDSCCRQSNPLDWKRSSQAPVFDHLNKARAMYSTRGREIYRLGIQTERNSLARVGRGIGVVVPFFLVWCGGRSVGR